MSSPLITLDRYLRHNRALCRWLWLDSAIHIGGILLAVVAAALLAAYGLRSMQSLHHGLALALLLLLAAHAGITLCRQICLHRGRLLFRDWLRVLPIPFEALVGRWRASSLGLAAPCAMAGCAWLFATAASSRFSLAEAGAAMAVWLATMSITMLLSLARPPALARPHTPIPAQGWTGAALHRLDSRTVPGLGAWQVRRGWRKRDVLVLASLASLLLPFTILLGLARGTALPIMSAGALLGAAVFNKSLDAAVLLSPALRVLPLTRLGRLIALVKLPCLLSLGVFLATVVVAMIALWPTASLRAIAISGLIATGMWLLLTATRLAVQIRWPAGGPLADAAYVAWLAAGGMLIATGGPAGVVLYPLVCLALLRTGLRKL